MSLFKLRVRKVVGHSMEPTLKEGQLVVFKHKTFGINSIILAEHKGKEIVKRIVRIEDHGNKIWLEGDNKNTHHNLIVERQAITGMLVWPRI